MLRRSPAAPLGALLIGGLLLAGVGMASPASAASYGPWSGTVRLSGPVPGGAYPGSQVIATYTVGKQSASNPSTYAASISWQVSGTGNPHTCGPNDRQKTGSDTYSGAGTAPGTVRVTYGSGAYTVTAASNSEPNFTVTDGCGGGTSNGSTFLGPASRSQPSASNNRTTLSATGQSSASDSWTVSYSLSRRPPPSTSPTPTGTSTPRPTRTPTHHHSATPSSSASASATASASASATDSPTSGPGHTPKPGASATASPTASATPTAVTPGGPSTPPPSSGPVAGGDSGGDHSGPSGDNRRGFGVGGESGLAEHVADSSQIPTDARSLLLDAALAFLLVIMLLFPAELFNGTLMENYDEVRGWFGPLGRLGTALENHPLLESKPIRWLGAVTFTAVTAALYGLVDPEFAFNGPSLRLFIALVLGLVAMTVFANGAALLFVRWRYGVGGHLRLRPGTLVLALGCVLLSRLVHIQPGYVYGIVAGFQFSRELDRAQEGHAVAAWAGWLFGLSIVAWLLIEPARHLVERHEGAFLPLVAEEVTAALTVEGLTVLLLALAPIRFLHGERLLRWSRPAWVGIYGLVIFAFFAISVRPEWAGTEATVPLRIWLVLFLAFCCFSVTFWSYFRFRHPRAAGIE